MGVRRGYVRALALVASIALFCVFSGLVSARAMEEPEDLEEFEAWDEGEDWEERWYPLDPAGLTDGDIVAITGEYDGELWAIDNACGLGEVCLDGQGLVSLEGEIGWVVTLEEGFLLLEPLAEGGLLSFSEIENGLSLDGPGDGRWTLTQGQLQHYMTRDWLCLRDLTWTVSADVPEGQELRFWTPFPPEEPGPPEEPEEPEESDTPMDLPDFPWTPWFGQLHAHTNLSDGFGEVEEAFRYAREEAGLDFFAITDHSTSFDNWEKAQIGADAGVVSEAWARGKAAARDATSEDFVGIFGYEMTWPDVACLGHIVTFATPGFQMPDQPGFRSLEGYYQALATVPESVGMFAHPGMFGGDLENFAHRSAAYDAQMDLLEVGGENGFRAWEDYTAALDAGWHLAPAMNQANHQGGWGTEDAARTVILAENLTEEHLWEAVKARRVYATEDEDLAVFFTLNGQIMGSRVPAGPEAVVQVWITDPTDAIGMVEVVTAGGQVADLGESLENQAAMEFILPGDMPYYYLRVTQPDGDVAVTAPVWLEGYEDMGIESLTVEGPELRGRRAEIALTVFNDEPEPLELSTVTIYADGEVLMNEEDPGMIGPLETRGFTASYVVPNAGLVEYRAEVTGYVNGQTRQWTEDCPVWYREPELTSGLLAWGFLPETLHNLAALAVDFDLELELFDGELPEGGSVLLLGPPQEPLDPALQAQIYAFAENGGTLILCGQAEDPVAAQVLNELLEALGSTLRLRADRVLDEENSGERPDHLFPAVFSDEALREGGLLERQYYRHLAGCSVDSGGGSWLVRGWPSSHSSLGTREPVLLAWEDTAWGGRIAAAGCPFFTDEQMPLPENEHILPSANQSLLEALLGRDRDAYPLSAIEELRQGEPGGIYRIQGHVTAGTSSPHNRFPGAVYLQDGTGGIAVADMPEGSLEIGQCLDVLGILSRDGENPILKRIRDRRPEGNLYRYVPLPLTCREAMDVERHGGTLLQIEGTVEGVVPTEDGRGVSRFSLRDDSGDLANFRVEAGIGAWATGRNDLATVVLPGSTVRAVGILHMEADGPVLRVRDCEEVMAILPPPEPPQEETQPEPSQETTGPSQEETMPSQETDPPQEESTPWPWQSKADKANPKTGDGLGRWLAWGKG